MSDQLLFIHGVGGEPPLKMVGQVCPTYKLT